jgi:hypothetical protein
MTGELLQKLSRDGGARLKWQVCRTLGIAPGSLTYRLMSRRRVIEYACQMVLDMGAESAQTGESFDMGRFLRLKEGAK